jgi:very-short-patch-repair endonuclease
MQAGMLTRHVRDEHGLSKKEYVIEKDYNGDPPTCKCGYCDKMPSFRRGEFKDYAKGHKSHKWRREQYIKKYGDPLCQECGEPVGFRRGEPKKYCSFKCSGKNAGFSLDSTQKAIKKTVQERYGVSNVNQLDSVREKISKARKGNNPWKGKSKKERKNYISKLRKASKENWKDSEFKSKTVSSIKETLNQKKYKKKRSREAKERWKDPEYVKKTISSLSESLGKSGMSDLHKKVRERLNLEEAGFVPEQPIGNYIVDEVNEDKKIIIEIFGDYVHANPSKYNSNDLIRLPGNSYLAKEKWKRDEQKVKYLKEQGYEVLIVWESDSLDSINFIESLN